MKKIAYFSGAFFSSITILSILFKTLHLQGAQILYVIGMLGIALVFIPTFAKYKYDEGRKT